jgi:hypothetical protein
MKKTKAYMDTPMTTSVATTLITPYFKFRCLFEEINFNLKIAALACLAIVSVTLQAQAFESVLQLSSLDGSTGFRLDGVKSLDISGESVSGAGDVNGDGIDDLLIGARFADPNGSNSGSTYVVFGRSSGFASKIDLSSLDGSSGFRLDGVTGDDESGLRVSGAGDINDDGIDDLLIGARFADPSGSNSGSTYVVFGRSSGFAAVIGLSSLNGSTGFRLDGVNEGDTSGRSVSTAGDVNGDGIDDLLIGAPGADFSRSESGSTYVVFGRSSGFASVIGLSTLNGSTGFRLDGVSGSNFVGDESGFSVSAAGDVNDDGIDDLLIGAPGADPSGSSSGSSYVVFGRSSGFTPVIGLSSLDGSTGFRLDGVNTVDAAGWSVSGAGDVNGDGVDDLLIGAFGTDSNGSNSGSSYVVFGRRSGFQAVIDLTSLDGATGFRLDGLEGEFSGWSVSASGDINGDGIDDLLIGAFDADPNGTASGSTYVVFGVNEIIDNIDDTFCVPVKTPAGGTALICL